MAAGIFTLSELYVGTAHGTTALTSVTGGTGTADTFVDTSTTTTTKLVKGAANFTGIGNTRTIEVSEVMGEGGARKYLGLINVEDIALALDFDPSDAGQILLRDQLTAARGYVIVVKDPSGTIVEYWAFNGVYYTTGDLNPNSKGVLNTTIAVTGTVQFITFVA